MTTWTPPVVRAAYGFCPDTSSAAEAFSSGDLAITEQAHAKDCDINTIVKRFGITGELPQSARQPLVGDFTHITDFHSAMEAVRHAQAGFMDLPADVRAQFGNDPGVLLAFLEDPSNREKAVELGLIHRPEPQTLVPAAAVSESATSQKLG